MSKQNKEQNHIDDEILTESQASKYLKFSPKALQKWRCIGGGPKYIKVSSKAIRYRKSDLIQWAQDRLQGSTSESRGCHD